MNLFNTNDSSENIELGFQLAEAGDFYSIKNFLKRYKTYSANRTDWIFTVHQITHLEDPPKVQKNLIGMARLLPVGDDESSLWLRGLFIAPNYRGQGIASSLLQFMFEQIHEDKHFAQVKKIVAFSETTLQRFYEKNHYQQLTAEQVKTELPESLAERYRQSKRNNKRWLCWKIAV